MPDMTASIPHQLGRAEAKRRIQDQAEVLQRRFGAHVTHFQEIWTGDTLAFALTAMGQSISGRLVVEDRFVHLTVALPWFLSLFAKTIRPRIEQEARHLLTSHPHGARV